MNLTPDHAAVAFAVPARVGIVRVHRAGCALCRHRRVLYRIVVGSDISVDATEARCAPCWGVR